MGNDNSSKKKNSSKSRLLSALVVVILLAAALFIISDAPFIKGARDSLMQKLGYEAVDQGDSNDQGEAPGDGSGTVKPAGKGSYAVDVALLDEGDLPEYNGDHYLQVNGNIPEFPDDVYERASLVYEDGVLSTKGSRSGKIDPGVLAPYEYYGSLDDLDRCTYAYGCLGEETMPAEGQDRGDISSVHPSGWAKAQNWERCHLIAWALSAENANPSNLVTGTHYLNYDGMRPLEEEVEHYIWNTGNHVLYYTKPWFSGNELVARGVQMVAKSVEDNGKGISFNVYCFNVTPGAEIDYNTGIVTTEEQAKQDARVYVINTRSGVFHYPSCDGVKEMSEHNKKEVTATRKELTDQGYTPCGACEP